MDVGVRATHDCMDAGGRVTHGAVTEDAKAEGGVKWWLMRNDSPSPYPLPSREGGFRMPTDLSKCHSGQSKSVLEIIKPLMCSYELDNLPDVRDGLTRKERVVLYCLNQLQKELSGRNAPTLMLYGRVVEHVNMSEDELQLILQRLSNYNRSS
jgi:hypothetical protein